MTALKEIMIKNKMNRRSARAVIHLFQMLFKVERRKKKEKF